MKIIAYYLPQFHEIRENNEWWGEGFTEWTNVKKAQPLFKGHKQPKAPMEGYYCLLEKEAMKRQADVAEKYGVFGMAFYHYWFEGRLLLEKPAEKLLNQWKDINLNFMFFWANHDWVRSWKGSKELLLKQSYGGKKDWIDHFNYMLPFFKDARYIKKDNYPIVGIYMVNSIPNVDDMIQTWNELAKENGMPGVYVIETALSKNYHSISKKTNAIVLREPNISILRYNRIYNISKRIKQIQPLIPGCYPFKISYKKVVEQVLKNAKEYQSDKDIMLGAFTGWDNTPRHGKRGSIVINRSPELFEECIKRLITIAKERAVEYVFINAWNEWCEGMYLEPDMDEGYTYLESIKNVLTEKG